MLIDSLINLKFACHLSIIFLQSSKSDTDTIKTVYLRYLRIKHYFLSIPFKFGRCIYQIAFGLKKKRTIRSFRMIHVQAGPFPDKKK